MILKFELFDTDTDNTNHMYLARQINLNQLS